MAKMTRSSLKNLVKECLIEILAEGLAGSPAQLGEAVGQRASVIREERAQSRPRPRSTTLDTLVVANPDFETNVQEAVQTLSDDPVMQSILADTARGSLQETLKRDSSFGTISVPDSGPVLTSPTVGPMIPGDPSAIFDKISPGASDKWAQLAFAPPRNRPESR